MEIAARGPVRDVIWAVDDSGRMPALRFFSGLDRSDRAKMQALFNRLAKFREITNSEKFKNIGKRWGLVLWELKSFQLRFLGGFVGDRQFVVAHGLVKKRGRHQPQDLDRAARILREHLRAVKGEVSNEGEYALRTSR